MQRRLWISVALSVFIASGCSLEDLVGEPALTYPVSSVAARAGETVDLTPSLIAGGLSGFTVNPALPTGIMLDSATGRISGIPAAPSSNESYTVRATSIDGMAIAVSIDLRVGEALPAAVASLASGFQVVQLASGLARPVRMDMAPDGRLFVNHLDFGEVQVLQADDTWMPAPFLDLDVATGGHRGLLGLALSPDFATDNFVYLSLVVPAGGGDPERIQVRRYTDSFGVGTNETILVDDLPSGSINLGGELLFDATGNLLLTLGDGQVPADAQDPLSLSGKVLRYTAAGLIPADNPSPASPVWCSGLRNPFALALDDVGGHLYVADNGPASDDRLGYLQAGKNFGWGTATPIGADAGFVIRTWADVIVPTAIASHPRGSGWGALPGGLLVASYDLDAVLVLDLAAGVNFQSEQTLLSFAPAAGNANTPLDLEVDPTGRIYVSTFDAIYRIEPF